MSVGETPGEPGSASVDAGGQLSGLLAGLEAWLTTQPPLGTASSSPTDGPDLSTLLREFIALRQEINLLTRAARTQQEQNGRTLDELTDALTLLRQQSEEEEDDDSEPPAVIPMPPRAAEPQPLGEESQVNLKQLVEARDALARAEREMQKSRGNLEQVLTEAVTADPEEVPLPEPPPVGKVSWLARMLGVRGPDPAAWLEYARVFAEHQAERRGRLETAQQARQTLLGRVRQIVASLLEGYSMSLQRIDRLLLVHELEQIAAEGQRFDPERMEALESVTGSGRPTGEVVEEVRRGYMLRGRVFRFALVRVAREG